MAAIWEGTITFGLVEIPVALRPAEERSEEVSFTQLDRKDLSPIGYRRYNKSSGREVEWNDIVRGFEYQDGEYVLVSDEELREAQPKLTKTIDIAQFADLAEIEAIYFDRPYYLQPKKQGSKAYRLLRETLAKTGKVGIATVVIRTRQHMAAVAPRESALALYVLRYAHEIRDPNEVAPHESGKDAKISAAEVKMAEMLVESMAKPFDPSEWKDEYHDKVLEMVREKARSGKIREVREPKREARRGQVIDLMARLKESVAQQRAGGRATREPKRAASKRNATSGTSRPARSHERSRKTA